MKQNIGIWIDTKQAVIVTLNEKNYSLEKIDSEIETRERIPGEVKKYGRFGGQYLTYEKHRENKKQEQIKNFFKKILPKIQDSNLVIFGPSNMKILLKKELLEQHQINCEIEDVISEDTLTENQTISWVKDYYLKLH